LTPLNFVYPLWGAIKTSRLKKITVAHPGRKASPTKNFCQSTKNAFERQTKYTLHLIFFLKIVSSSPAGAGGVKGYDKAAPVQGEQDKTKNPIRRSGF
jgi:hypothetical protein